MVRGEGRRESRVGTLPNGWERSRIADSGHGALPRRAGPASNLPKFLESSDG